MSFFDRILSALGLTERAPKSRVEQRSIKDQALWLQVSRIGGSLTPTQLSSILREADSGYMCRLMDLANEARQKDAHLHAVLAQCEESIAGLDWELVLPEDASESDREIAEDLGDYLRAHPGFRRLVAHTVGAHFYGFSVTETVWRKFEGRKARLYPGSFVPLAHRRFAYRQSDGVFVLRDDGQVEVDLRDQFPAGKFIIAHPRVTGDVPCREGLVRVLMWAALFRNWGIADWLRTAEIAWKPWRVGKYNRNEYASPEDVNGLASILDSMSTTGVALIPNTVDIDVSWAQGGQSQRSTHRELVDAMGREMSKAALGQTETTESSSSSGYGQAKVHRMGYVELREARARSVESVFNADLIDPFYDLNFGENVVRARIRFATQDPVDLKAFAEGVAKLVAAGARIPHEFVWNQAGIPEPEEEDEVLVPPTPAPKALPAGGEDDEEDETPPKESV